MEKQINTILVNLLNNIIPENDSFLKGYYTLFDKRKYIGNEFSLIYEDMKEVYGLEKNFFNYDNQMQKTYEKLILALLNIQESKKRLKLIPLIIYLDINHILYNYLFDNDYFLDFKKIKDFFMGVLKDSHVDINLKNTPQEHWERELVAEYNQGLDEKDFKKIYNFVGAIERGIGFKYDEFLDFISYLSVKIFLNDFIDIINSKNNILDIRFILHSLTNQEKLLLASKSTNILVKFEAIKECIYFRQNDNLLKAENDLISKILLDLSDDKLIWEKCLLFYLEYPSRNPQLFLPLSKVLNEINKEKINIFIDSIKINQYIDDTSTKSLNNAVFNIQNIELQEYIIKNIFIRWENFIDSFDDYFSSIFLTDVIDIVIVYINDFVNKEDIIAMLDKVILNIDEIENHWFDDSTKKRNYLYKELSKLFVFGFSLEKYQLDNYKKKIKKIINNYKETNQEHQYNAKNTYDLFHEYILQDNINEK